MHQFRWHTISRGRCIGGFPTVVVPDDHLRMVFPPPTRRARTADSVYVLSSWEQRARSKYRIESSDVEESPSSKGPCLRPEYTPHKQMIWREM
jgi:hypothetical protein